MISVSVPGRGQMELFNLVLDFNGTFALDGKMLENVPELLHRLAEYFRIHVITADTNGTAREACKDMPVTFQIMDADRQAEKKAEFVRALSPKGTVCIGNGANDLHMFQEADLAIAVIGGEGCYTRTLLESDIAVQQVTDAFELLLRHNRFIATLRR